MTQPSPSPGTDARAPAAAPSESVTALASGAGVNLAGRLAGQGTHLLGQVVLARLLEPQLYGLYAIGWTIVRMAGILLPLGLEDGVLRFGTRYRDDDAPRYNGVVWQSIEVALLSGTAAGLALFWAAPWLAEAAFGKPSAAPVLQGVAAALPFVAAMKVAVSTTRVSQRMKFGLYAEDLAQPLTNLVLIALLCGLGGGLGGAVAACTVSYAVALATALGFLRHLFPGVSTRDSSAPRLGRELFAFCLPAVFAGVTGNFMVWVDRLIVAHFRPEADVGIYQAMSQAAIAFSVILSAFNTMLSPMVADCHHRNDSGQLRDLYRAGTKWGLYLGTPLFLVICFAPREVIQVVFGDRYESGAIPMVIMSAGQLVRLATGAVAPLLVLTGHQTSWLVLSAATLTANVALNGFLVPRYGLLGAALSTGLSLAALFVSGLFLVRRKLGLWPYDRRFLKGLVAAAAAAAALQAIAVAGPSDPALRLAASTLASAAVFAGVLLLLGLDAEDRQFLQWIRARHRGARPEA